LNGWAEETRGIRERKPGNRIWEQAPERPSYYCAYREPGNPIRRPVQDEVMENKDLWAQYVGYTDQASQIARHLGFAAAGLLWAIGNMTDHWSAIARLGLAFVVLFFMADLVQYVFAAVRRRLWIRAEEKKRWSETGSIEGEYLVPPSLDTPAYIIWWAKLGLLTLSFLAVGAALLG